MTKHLKTYMTAAFPRPLLLLGLLTLGLGALAGCDSTAGEEQTSRVRVLLTDAPADDFVEANVVIERVEFLNEEDTVVLLAEEPEPFDLLTLQDGTTALLADLEIPNDTYHGVRIIVNEEAHVVYTDGTTEDLKVPSGSQTGIKINLPPIEVDDDLVEVTIDFDLEDSFVKRGNSGKGYIFKPVLKPLALTVNGEAVDLFDEEALDGEG
jgi:hypothetical protein